MSIQSTASQHRFANIAACLGVALTTLEVVSESFRTPFLEPISNTLRSLLNTVQTVKRNKDVCTQMLEQIYMLLDVIIRLQVASDTGGELPPNDAPQNPQLLRSSAGEKQDKANFPTG
ncbi:hypothetical protein DFH09DRAFT_1072256 [Mycena vulgaris]|nr:hypothetical protein DFH09DRAFT_1072256 [Mycena vulgaris]